MQDNERLDQDQFIRRRLYSSSESATERYSKLVIGETGFWKLLRYELITSLFGPLPGAVGIALRRVFFPILFKKVGKGVVFGRSVTIRCPARISLGDKVVIDDYCVLDGRAAGEEGLTLGDEVIVNRASLLLAKGGPIHVGSHSDIGAQTVIVSQGGTTLGKMVTVGGGCKIGGGGVDFDMAAAPDDVPADPNDFGVRGQARYSKGPVEIGDKTVFGRSVMVLDGARVGADCLLGSGVIIREEIPDRMAVLPRPAHVIVPRGLLGEAEAGREPDAEETASSSAGGEATERIERSNLEDLTYQILDEINAQLTPDQKIAKQMDSPLMEPEGPLDSLGLVNLIVAAESVLKRELQQSFNLSSALERAAGANPLATTGSFVEWLDRTTRGES